MGKEEEEKADVFSTLTITWSVQERKEEQLLNQQQFTKKKKKDEDSIIVIVILLMINSYIDKGFSTTY